MLLRDTSSSKPHRRSVDTLLDEKTLLQALMFRIVVMLLKSITAITKLQKCFIFIGENKNNKQSG